MNIRTFLTIYIPLERVQKTASFDIGPQAIAHEEPRLNLPETVGLNEKNFSLADDFIRELS